MGIANPVTRETHGSGTHYHLQLAKQLGDMLQAPLEVGVSFCVPVSYSKYITNLFVLSVLCICSFTKIHS